MEDIEIEEKVERLNEHTKYVITSPKHTAKFTVDKAPGGFIFYCIKTEKGVHPKSLEGLYTKPEDAIKAVKKYIDSAPVTRAKQVADYKQRRKEELEKEAS